MNDLYSPNTQEHISSNTPAEWMGRAGVAAPAYNPQTAGCFWRGTAWEVVVAVPDKISNPAIDAIDAQLAALDSKKIRPMAEGDTVYLATLNAKTLVLRTQRAALPLLV